MNLPEVIVSPGTLGLSRQFEHDVKWFLSSIPAKHLGQLGAVRLVTSHELTRISHTHN